MSLNMFVESLGYNENGEPDAPIRCVGCATVMDPFGGQKFPNVVRFPDGTPQQGMMDVGMCNPCVNAFLNRLAPWWLDQGR